MLWKNTSRCAVVLSLATVALSASLSPAQERPTSLQPAAEELLERSVPTVAVVVDGVALFQVRGTSAFPAGERAAVIGKRILDLARNPSFDADSLTTTESELGTEIMGGDSRIMIVTEADANIEGVGRTQIATFISDRIRTAIREYRDARSRESLTSAGLAALAGTGVLILALIVARWLWRRIDSFVERRFRGRLKSLESQSFQLVRAESLWVALRGTLRVVRTLIVLALCFAYFQFLLSSFPWTHAFADRLGNYVISPLVSIGTAVVAQVPDLIFLAVLILVFRYLLGLLRLFFDAVRRGTITFENFDPDWAAPTYKLARLAVIAFGLVVAYPYIPGSSSAAFKGVSLFIGVVFSLGSSSAISNLIAGLMLTYRRAFKIGDRVQIGEVSGDVIEMRLQVTHIRTVKNEEVVVPNSLILNSHVVNFSSLARSRGLILHTTVGIGYETPWRQVEAMLLIAAGRTPGLLADPSPFVLQKALGDFCVTYELNVFCNDPQAMATLYTALHRSILDVFNEHGVQIMTPAYEGDPEQPKIVPREEWFTAPARQE